MTYKTVKSEGVFSFTEKKSEFIGYCAPVKTEAEAIEFVNRIKKKHSDAKHNVYAYNLRAGNMSRFSDDGEPHGTAGLPIIEMLRKLDITDVVIVVTRYFGGVLLGTGGLVRAYTTAASGALKESKIGEVGIFALVEISTSYSDYQKIMPLISSVGAKVETGDFSSNVEMLVTVRDVALLGFITDVRDITNGRVNAKAVGEKCDFIRTLSDLHE